MCWEALAALYPARYAEELFTLQIQPTNAGLGEAWAVQRSVPDHGRDSCKMGVQMAVMKACLELGLAVQFDRKVVD